jgi:hypothetical protein
MPANPFSWNQNLADVVSKVLIIHYFFVHAEKNGRWVG